MAGSHRRSVARLDLGTLSCTQSSRYRIVVCLACCKPNHKSYCNSTTCTSPKECTGAGPHLRCLSARHCLTWPPSPPPIDAHCQPDTPICYTVDAATGRAGAPRRRALPGPVVSVAAAGCDATCKGVVAAAAASGVSGWWAQWQRLISTSQSEITKKVLDQSEKRS